ncbi:hypothetical protein OIU74_018275 [Salix koriyanagi]|uniref:Uncharacterized protein n=1 Tax=Salix koriyanagi TaxID=2511006 RepID=A0A9Q0WRZ7_9ROSI|nr:hypothetical protein OIU74_018275 [Salix koriyanagi]
MEWRMKNSVTARSSSTQSKAMAAPAASLLSLRCPSSPFKAAAAAASVVTKGSGWTIWARNRGLERKERGIPAAQGNSCGLGMRGQKSISGPGVRKGFEGGQMPLYSRVPNLRGIAGETLEEKGLIKPSGRERTLPLKIFALVFRASVIPCIWSLMKCSEVEITAAFCFL